LAARAIQDEMRVENWCYGCGPQNPEGLQIKSYWEGNQALCTYQPRTAFMAGPRHVLNGGIIATLIDCHSICTAIAAIYQAEQRPIGSDPPIWCVTGSLELQYLRPTPIDQPVVLRARVESSQGRRTTIACTLSSGEVERVHGRVVAVRVPPSWRSPS
jgi:acyl-coenzyme A thioesterase PaaI-like protein